MINSLIVAILIFNFAQVVLSGGFRLCAESSETKEVDKQNYLKECKDMKPFDSAVSPQTAQNPFVIKCKRVPTLHFIHFHVNGTNSETIQDWYFRVYPLDSAGNKKDLSTTKWQYRVKQKDYDGSFMYCCENEDTKSLVREGRPYEVTKTDFAVGVYFIHVDKEPNDDAYNPKLLVSWTVFANDKTYWQMEKVFDFSNKDAEPCEVTNIG